jgi:potassium efflux system protein
MQRYGWLTIIFLLFFLETAVGQGIPLPGQQSPPNPLPPDVRQHAQPILPATQPLASPSATVATPRSWWDLDTGVTRTTFFEQAASGALNPLRNDGSNPTPPSQQPANQPPANPTGAPPAMPTISAGQNGPWVPDRWNSAARTAALPSQPQTSSQPPSGGQPTQQSPPATPVASDSSPQNPLQPPPQVEPPTETPQQAEAAPKSPGVLPMIEAGISDVQARLAETEAIAELDAETKSKAVSILQKAMEWLNLARDSELQRRQFEQESVAGPEIVEQIKAQLAQSLPAFTAPSLEGATLVQLESQLTSANTEFEAAQATLTAASESLKKRTQRKAEIGQLSEEVAKRLKDAIAALKNPPKDGLHPAVSGAHQLELQARRVAAEVQLQLFKAESVRLDAVTELLPLQRDLAKRNADWHQQHAAAWKEIVADFRKMESQRQAKLARRAAAQAHPKLKGIADVNAQLTQQRTEYAAKIEDANQKLEFAQTRLQGLTDRLDDIHEKVEIGGLSVSIGHLLRRQREELPNLTKHRSRLAEIEVTLPEIQLQAIDLVEQRNELGHIDETIAEILDGLQPEDSNVAPEEIEAMARDFLSKQRDYVEALSNDLDAYQDILSELDLATRKLISQTLEYQDYIDEHVLWIRSADRVSLKDVNKATAGLATIFEWKQSKAFFGNVWSAIKQRPVGALLVVALFVAGLFVRHWFKEKNLSGANVSAARRNESPLKATLRALLVAIAVAGVAPIAAWLVGNQLVSVATDGSLTHAIGLALRHASALFFATEFARLLFSSRGVAEVHFGWASKHLEALRWSLMLLIVGGVPLYFVGVASNTFQNGEWADSLGRLTFVAGMVLLAVVVIMASRPARAILEQRRGSSSSKRTNLLSMSIKVLQPLVIATPLLLGLLAVLGYYYSAQQLAIRLKWMFWISLAIAVGHNVASRIIGVVHKQLVKKRKAMLRARLLTKDESAPDMEFDEAQDAIRVGQQVRRLLHGATLTAFAISCWFVWAEAMPALQILDRVELWSVAKDVTETVAAADGTTSQTTVKQILPITLTHVFICIGIVAVTLVAARNLPGLLQITVLERLPLDRGGKHAIALLGRYLVTVCGAIWAFNTIGFSWSSVQWLIAAMTVGLGFGLQEIFANFVAGVIILFERPIRIGDLVTVGGTTGTVTKMQIRATTITDFDRRELLVPNKSFITQEVINWTLSDSTSRVVIKVGIAYGSNTKLAEEILLRLADEHPLILKEPPPSAVFCNFGDSTLNFELRFYLSTRDHYVTALHEMNNSIDQAFRAGKIEIAFPQQDLHIRGLPADVAEVMEKAKEIDSHSEAEDEQNQSKAA